MAGTYVSGFWGADGVGGTRNDNPIRNRIKRVMNRDGQRAVTELFDSLVGAATGGTALATHSRVGHQDSNTAGNNEARVVSVTDINRVTTAADVTALKEMTFNVRTRPTSYPRDLSGNGGPSF